MGDRLQFRALVIESLRARGLSLTVAMGAMSDHGDLYDTGLPADDAADLVFRTLHGEHRAAPMGT